MTIRANRFVGGIPLAASNRLQQVWNRCRPATQFPALIMFGFQPHVPLVFVATDTVFVTQKLAMKLRNDIGRCWLRRNDVGRCWLRWNDVGGSWLGWNNIGRWRLRRNDIGRLWFGWNNIGRYWRRWNYISRFWLPWSTVGQSWLPRNNRR